MGRRRPARPSPWPRTREVTRGRPGAPPSGAPARCPPRSPPSTRRVTPGRQPHRRRPVRPRSWRARPTVERLPRGSSAPTGCSGTQPGRSRPRRLATSRAWRRRSRSSSRAWPNGVRASGSPSCSHADGPGRHRSSAQSSCRSASSSCPESISASASTSSDRYRSASTLTAPRSSCDETGAGDRNPVQRRLQSEQAMEPRRAASRCSRATDRAPRGRDRACGSARRAPPTRRAGGRPGRAAPRPCRQP